MVGTPTVTQLNDVKQDTVQWSAKSKRVTAVDESGTIYSSSNPLPVSSVAHTSSDLEGKGFVSVGTSAVELTFTGTTESIIISSAIANTGVIYVGLSNVTSAGANAIAFLDVGESLIIDYNDVTNGIYVVASIAAQSVMAGAGL